MAADEDAGEPDNVIETDEHVRQIAIALGFASGSQLARRVQRVQRTDSSGGGSNTTAAGGSGSGSGLSVDVAKCTAPSNAKVKLQLQPLLLKVLLKLSPAN